MSRTTHAVVIGGSVAGLCAARVLSKAFDRVTVLDRDVYPDEAQHRKGVPQSRHPHVLLDGGRQRLEELFPGFIAIGYSTCRFNPVYGQGMTSYPPALEPG